jgi:hypothetical protein
MPIEKWNYENVTLDQMEPFFRGKVSYVRGLDTGAQVIYQGEEMDKVYDLEIPKDDQIIPFMCMKRTIDGNIIELPDYWEGLVDEETIGVSLTSIGVYQELFVEKIESSKIKIRNNLSGPINCYYTITAERKDTSKNIPEYKGLSSDDYPGDNSEYAINTI